MKPLEEFLNLVPSMFIAVYSVFHFDQSSIDVSSVIGIGNRSGDWVWPVT